MVAVRVTESPKVAVVVEEDVLSTAVRVTVGVGLLVTEKASVLVAALYRVPPE
jgi:hypothetical protein